MEQETVFQKIKTSVEESKSFGLLLDGNPNEHDFLAKEILQTVINKQNLPVLVLPKPPEEMQDKWAPLTKTPTTPTEFPKKTSLKLPKEKYDIKEVSYKEDGNNLSLIITSKDNILSNEDIRLEILPPEIDMAFCFFEDLSKTEIFQNEIQLPHNEKIILLTPTEKSLTEKILDIIKIFDEEILEQKEIATLLLASLLIETDNFSRKITEQTLTLASLLLKKGAQKELILNIIDKEKKLSYVQLLGRVLARTYIDEISNISWSFLNNKDLQKTNNTQPSLFLLQKLLKKTQTLTPIQNSHVLLWQINKDVKAITLKQNTFTISEPFENFSKAEIYLRNKLKIS
ncbi:hypothetical protein ACFL1O_00085 [Patescibacteria group bacterium]